MSSTCLLVRDFFLSNLQCPSTGGARLSLSFRRGSADSGAFFDRWCWGLRRGGLGCGGLGRCFAGSAGRAASFTAPRLATIAPEGPPLSPLSPLSSLSSMGESGTAGRAAGEVCGELEEMSRLVARGSVRESKVRRLYPSDMSELWLK